MFCVFGKDSNLFSARKNGEGRIVLNYEATSEDRRVLLLRKREGESVRWRSDYVEQSEMVLDECQ